WTDMGCNRSVKWKLRLLRIDEVEVCMDRVGSKNFRLRRNNMSCWRNDDVKVMDYMWVWRFRDVKNIRIFNWDMWFKNFVIMNN
ncbi:hypothetical protein, partial [Staphylococcus epidermidis]|uniref:hypothetical protein n=1 Tax=Staphylococcus epidermidis TaxID=1282 RepID=UPI0021B1C97D